MDHPKHWDEEIARMAKMGPELFRLKPDAVVGLAVDDAKKRDYFAPRLQRLMTDGKWSGTIRIVPVNGDDVVILRAKGD